ncbi:hypothetical protein F5X68DRAFT_197143 [Plectosphaerella plurivora]|uniref:Uncharacterized protein n=1 Tax=Plectosphaerella plurivora TaxID=936078 RepID=A0A9P9ADA2_9PEZI|nr:hypothetical protein F5X68DRAFT_197143 [Plectosphaerella plurivora]
MQLQPSRVSVVVVLLGATAKSRPRVSSNDIASQSMVSQVLSIGPGTRPHMLPLSVRFPLVFWFALPPVVLFSHLFPEFVCLSQFSVICFPACRGQHNTVLWQTPPRRTCLVQHQGFPLLPLFSRGEHKSPVGPEARFGLLKGGFIGGEICGLGAESPPFGPVVRAFHTHGLLPVARHPRGTVGET